MGSTPRGLRSFDVSLIGTRPLRTWSLRVCNLAGQNATHFGVACIWAFDPGLLGGSHPGLGYGIPLGFGLKNSCRLLLRVARASASQALGLWAQALEWMMGSKGNLKARVSGEIGRRAGFRFQSFTG